MREQIKRYRKESTNMSRSATNENDLDAKKPRNEELSREAETHTRNGWGVMAGMNERTHNESLKKKQKKKKKYTRYSPTRGWNINLTHCLVIVLVGDEHAIAGIEHGLTCLGRKNLSSLLENNKNCIQALVQNKLVIVVHSANYL